MRLILIRHGETKWNEVHRFQGFSDIELSPRGICQAKLLAESLKEEKLEAIYTSPLLRARQTAEEVARYHACPIIVEEGLKELNQGQLEGLTAEDLHRDYSGLLQDWMSTPETVRLPQGESLGDLMERTWKSVERMRSRHPGATLAAVAHSFVNQTIICRALEIPLRACRFFRQAAASKNILEFTPRGTYLWSLNETCHLKTLNPES